MAFILFLLEEVAQAFARGGFGRDHRIATHAAGVASEYVSYVLRLDVGFHRVVVEACHTADVSLLHIALKFVVGDILATGAVLVGHPQAEEHHHNEHIQPVQVELGYIDFIVIVVAGVFLVVVIVIVVHTFLLV